MSPAFGSPCPSVTLFAVTRQKTAEAPGAITSFSLHSQLLSSTPQNPQRIGQSLLVSQPWDLPVSLATLSVQLRPRWPHPINSIKGAASFILNFIWSISSPCSEPSKLILLSKEQSSILRGCLSPSLPLFHHPRCPSNTPSRILSHTFVLTVSSA